MFVQLLIGQLLWHRMLVPYLLTLIQTDGESMHPDSGLYNQAQAEENQLICQLLAGRIDAALPEAENKIWHAHPV